MNDGIYIADAIKEHVQVMREVAKALNNIGSGIRTLANIQLEIEKKKNDKIKRSKESAKEYLDKVEKSFKNFIETEPSV